MGSCNQVHYCEAVSVAGGLAYVADESNGVQVIDVSDPVAPTRLYACPTIGTASDVAAAGTLVFSVGSSYALQAFQVQAKIAAVSSMDATTYRVELGQSLPEGPRRVFIGPDVADTSGRLMDQDQDGVGGLTVRDGYTVTVTFDFTPPVAPPGVAFGPDTGLNGDGLTDASQVTFSWSPQADAAGIARYEYRLDSGDWGQTGQTKAVLTPTEGDHTFQVRAVDVLGRTGPAASISFSEDQTPPSPPPVLRLIGRILSWDPANDAHGIWKYQWQMDGAGWEDLAACQMATSIADWQTASFDVRAVDLAGNVGPIASATLTAVFGPRLIASTPSLADGLTVTFDRPVDPATFTAADVAVALPAPIRLGGYDTPGSAHGVTVVGNIAYVADHTSGLQILDVSDPAAPVRLGGYDTAGSACHVALAGTLAYVADGNNGLQVLDVSNPAAPVRLGGYVTSEYAVDVVLSGTHAYVSGGCGLEILDVSNPTAPSLLGSYYASGGDEGVAVVGTTAYLATQISGLVILDVSSPAAPVWLGACAMPDITYDVAVAGSVAVVADGLGGIRDVDVSNPAAPVLLGGCATGDLAQDVAVVGAVAFVTNGTSGLKVFDVTNPAAPVLLGGSGPTYCSWGVAVAGTVAYVADEHAGLLAFRVLAGPATVTPVDDTTFHVGLPADLPDGACRVFIGPDVAGTSGDLMDQDGDGLDGEPAEDVYSVAMVCDLTPPMPPADLAMSPDTGLAEGHVTSAGGVTFSWAPQTDVAGIVRHEYRLDDGDWVATGQLAATLTLPEGAYVFQVRAVDALGRSGQAASLSLVVDLTPPEAPSGLRLDGRTLRWDLAADANGIWKYQWRMNGGDWQDSSANQAVATVADGQIASFDVRALDTAGNVGPAGSASLTAVYGPRIIQPASGLVVGPAGQVTVTFDRPVDRSTFTSADVTIPLTYPRDMGACDTDGDANGLVIVGTLAYVADGADGRQILDVSNPAAPVLVGACATTDYARTVVVSGRLAYVVVNSGLQIIDVSDPAAPVWMGGYDTGAYPAGAVAVAGTLAYLTCYDGGLRIIDVSNPAAPVPVGNCDTGGMTYAVTVVGTTAYVADNWSGLQIIDVSNPSTPALLGSYHSADRPSSLAMAGTLAFLIEGRDTLEVIDVSDPDAPVRIGGCDTNDAGGGIRLFGSLAFVSGGMYGAQIVDVSDPANPMPLGCGFGPWDGDDVAFCGSVAFMAAESSGVHSYQVFGAPATVTPLSDTMFRVSFSPDSPWDGSRVLIGPDITGTSGSVMDQDGDGLGDHAVGDAYGVTVVEGSTRVVGRHVFYNNSYWDGNDPAGGPADDAAIAPDKQPLLPGQPAGPANYTDYSRGITGIMIDVMNDLVPVTFTAADFVFRAGNTNTPATWPLATPPTTINIRYGAGVDDSDRITLIWSDDSAVRNQWLSVEILPTLNTLLPAADVFCFGNLPGDANGDGVVDWIDYMAVKEQFGTAVHVPGSGTDFDCGGDVGLGDLVAVEASFGQSINMAFSPPAPTAAPIMVTSSDEAQTQAGPVGSQSPAPAGQGAIPAPLSDPQEVVPLVAPVAASADSPPLVSAVSPAALTLAAFPTVPQDLASPVESPVLADALGRAQVEPQLSLSPLPGGPVGRRGAIGLLRFSDVNPSAAATRIDAVPVAHRRSALGPVRLDQFAGVSELLDASPLLALTDDLLDIVRPLRLARMG